MSNINLPVINQVKQAALAALSKLVIQAVADAALESNKQLGGNPKIELVNLFPEREKIAQRFTAKLESYFDRLTTEKEESVNLGSYGSLSLVGEDDLEAIIAMEGMVAHARNSDISEYIKFTTRLNSLFYGLLIDESNNPLDPEQLGDAFKEAMQPLSLPARQLLIVYRQFNQGVFHKLEEVLEASNEILVANDVIPNLDVHARDKKQQKNKRNNVRPTAVAEERAFAENADQLYKTRSNPEMFAMMQTLMHGLAANNTGFQGAAPAGIAAAPVGAPAGAAGFAGGHWAPAGMLAANIQPGMMVGGNRVTLVPQPQLFDLLSSIEQRLVSQQGGGEINAALDLPGVLDESLNANAEQGTLRAIDGQSSDIINLVTLLYKAMWQDESLPIPIKELIGRTQILVLKVALSEPDFFNQDQHPARVLLNELAMTGIGWTEVDRLESDPTYSMMRQLVLRMLSEFNGDASLFERLLEEFREFRRVHGDGIKETEKRLSDAGERSQRIDEINSYVSRKIDERILETRIHPLVETLLKEHFHKFLVKLVLKEGPGGNGWKPVINTIDVLLWTVQARKQKGDKERFQKINPRLLENLGKAMRIAGLTKANTEDLLKQLLEIQKASFKGDRVADVTDIAEGTAAGEAVSGASGRTTGEQVPLPPEDEHLKEVDRLPVGVWVEFQGTDEQSIRCTLAARIDTIDKLVFVNRQGVKVVEKSRMGLARELKEGSVKIISDHPLFDRALESVIGILRDQQASQEAGSQPV